MTDKVRRVAGRQKVPLTYYRTNNSEKPSPFRGASRNKKPRKYFFGVVDILALTLLLAFFLYSLKVDSKADVSINNQQYRPPLAYQSAASTYLAKLKNGNKLTINESAVIDNLKSQFPEIVSGWLELPLVSHKPKIVLDISPPALLLTSSNDKHIISMNGVNVGKINEIKQPLSLPEVTDQSNFKTKKGQQSLSSYEAAFVNSLWQKAASENITIDGIFLTNQPMELIVQPANEPYFVKFFTGSDPAVQIGQYLAARKEFISSGNKPAEYLDVRIQGKIFYK